MTWLEWISSDYNTFGEFTTSEEIDVYFDETGQRIFYNGNNNQEVYPLGKDEIIENINYLVREGAVEDF